MGNRLGTARPDGMWKLVFYERNGLRMRVEKSAPWLPNRAAAEQWAQFYMRQGYCVGLQSQDGRVERLSKGLPA
ncbi:hypothetical protein I7X43_03730 [Inhella sp. 4Y17]|uniref:Uncharacterized protein n=2 Tax=Inhella gelatinilytica TaxID=2795030 RepID=A0A931IWK5_9BURK|nr:hypothetical protein [Inhella gelatinilytica]